MSVLGGRYWGPSTPEDAKVNLTSPSQASLLLARINDRARAKKAAQANVTNNPSSEVQQNGKIHVKLEEAIQQPKDVEASIDTFLKGMRNASGKVELENSITHDDETGGKIRKKDKKKKDNNADMTLMTKENITVKVEQCEVSEKMDREKEVQKEKYDYPNGTIKNEENEHPNAKELLGSRKKKKQKKHKVIGEFISEVEKRTVDLEAANDGEISSCYSEKHTSKKRKRDKEPQEVIIKAEVSESNDSSHPDDKEGANISKKKKKKGKLNLGNFEENGDTRDDSVKNYLHTPVSVKMEISDKGFDEESKVNDENGFSEIVQSKRKKKKNIKEMVVNSSTELSLPSIVDNNNPPEEELDNTNPPVEEVSNNNPPEEEVGSSNPPEEEANDSNPPEEELDNTNPPEEEVGNNNPPEEEVGSSNPPEEEANDSNPPEEEAAYEIPRKKNKKKRNELKTSEVVEEEATQEIADAPCNEEKSKKKGKRIKKGHQEMEKEIGFTLLKKVGHVKKEKLHRTLPHWLAHPTHLSRNLQEGVGAGLNIVGGLADWLKRKLEGNKITHFFPVQCAVIPELLASAGPITTRYRPRDICVSAPTGSGKTLAFVLPILQALYGRTVPKIRALVLLPVQELAHQVYLEFMKYNGGGVKVGLAAGHKNFKKEQAELVSEDYRGHHCRVDILVATPGRLADHLTHTPGLDFSALRYLVLDEADRMLATEGGEWVARIERAVSSHISSARDSSSLYASPPPHRLLFSATLSHDPEQLQHFTLHHPRLFTVARPNSYLGVTKTDGVIEGKYVRPAELLEEYVMVEEEVKPLLLHHLISGRAGLEGVWQRVLIFTNSLHATHRLAVLLSYLAPDRSVAEFSSSTRKVKNGPKVVSQFKAGKIDILVSSDAMARGLDIPGVEYVVSYDVTSVNNYVHRIGRTARAGKPGTALSLVTKDTLREFKAACRGGEDVRELAVTTEELEPYEEKYTAALAKLKELLKEEEQLKRKVLEEGAQKKNAGRQGKAKGKQNNNGRKPIKRLQNHLNHFRKPFKLR
ncbi:hypothetical protein Pcinc_025168 [Petrolisthes cinctipes]|uniref:ATP-dependent RNA helicase n=1 Tax=Petrolisthes cinctipes TaxID=88211 RepID=A0AAE1KDE7_PETCI|nr:hypothetical protein Pcinc_025168 [Petrolisthes cinctipes]